MAVEVISRCARTLRAAYEVILIDILRSAPIRIIENAETGKPMTQIIFTIPCLEEERVKMMNIFENIEGNHHKRWFRELAVLENDIARKFAKTCVLIILDRCCTACFIHDRFALPMEAVKLFSYRELHEGIVNSIPIQPILLC